MLLDSVICQTVLPKKWVIVSDGSTDCTDEIATKYAESNEYIDLLRVSGHNDRNFGSKVNAFAAGVVQLAGLETDLGAFPTQFSCFGVNVMKKSVVFFPINVGGEDTIAQIMARMNGCEVKSFTDIEVLHHKPARTGGGTVWRTRFHQGQQDYFLGHHVVYFLAKCLRRVLEKPYLFSSVLRMFGYFWSDLRRDERPVSGSFIRFHRREQIKRLRSLT